MNASNATENQTHVSTPFSCPLLDRYWGQSIGDMDTVYIVNCAINAVFSCLAFAANTLIMVTILRTPSLRSPTFYFVFGLAVTDFGVGLLAQPLYVLHRITGLYMNTKLNCVAGISFVLVSNQLAGVSCLTMTLISVDRFLALFLHLRYNELMTLFRVKIALVCAWILTAFSNIAWVLNLQVYLLLAASGFSLFLIITLFSYVMIFCTVRKHRHKIQEQSIAVSNLRATCSQDNSTQDNLGSISAVSRVRSHFSEQRLVIEPKDNPTSSKTANRSNRKRLDSVAYKKSVKKMFLVYFAFLLCTLPLMCVLGLSSILSRNTAVETAFNFTVSLVFIESTVNPFLCCILMKDLRKEVWKTLRRMSGHLSRA